MRLLSNRDLSLSKLAAGAGQQIPKVLGPNSACMCGGSPPK